MISAGNYIPDGMALLISGFDPSGLGRGGLYSWDERGITCLDSHDTTGLRMQDGRLFRCLWALNSAYTDVVEISPTGDFRRSRLDDVGNPHDVLLDGDLTVVVATAQNQVAWFRPDGTRARTWQPGAEPDSWHLNSLVRHDGRLLVSAFGQFARPKEWDLPDKPASGCVLDLESRRTVLTGLRAPHTPRYVDGQWLVCNSAAGQLLAIDAADRRTVLATLEGWLRGLLVTATLVFVGVSPQRHAEESLDAQSKISVLCRKSRKVLTEISVPAREIYDLVLVSRSMLSAARTCSAALQPAEQRELPLPR